MGKAQRTKGAAYEREVCDAFRSAYGVNVTRNIGQARDGGNDIDVGPLVIECKRRKTLTVVEQWMQQARDAAAARDAQLDMFNGAEGSIPVVIGRSDGGKSLVVLELADFLDIAGAFLGHYEPPRR